MAKREGTPRAGNIVQFLEDGMVDVVDEVRSRIENGEVHSLAIVMEVQGQSVPLIAMRGRFERDPFRALLALERAQYKVHQQIDQLESGNV